MGIRALPEFMGLRAHLNPIFKPLFTPIFVISTILILSVIAKLFASVVILYFSPDALKSFQYSEFLINFSGGFVRRGLLGEILLTYTSLTNNNPKLLITIICIAAYLFVACFFLKKFKEKEYCWWVVLSPLMCGFTVDIIRKDYLLYAILICSLYLARDISSQTLLKRIAATAIVIIGILIHEAFIFWGAPILTLIFLSDRRHIKSNIVLIGLILAVFIISCIFKGDIYIMNSIIDSWNTVLPDVKITYKPDSIGALAWDTKNTMIMHIQRNLGSSDNYIGLIYWPIIYFIAYYFVTFYLSVFKKEKSSHSSDLQTIVSTLFLTQSLCLTPMFTILSCDYGRLFQYITIPLFAIILIIDLNKLRSIFPQRIINDVARLNSWLRTNIPPTKAVFIFILLTFGISPCFYDPTAAMSQSPVGSLYVGAQWMVRHLFF